MKSAALYGGRGRDCFHFTGDKTEPQKDDMGGGVESEPRSDSKLGFFQ